MSSSDLERKREEKHKKYVLKKIKKAVNQKTTRRGKG
jgi:hypothetical protein